MTSSASPMPDRQPLAGVHDETIFYVLNAERGSKSWFDKCNELEAALVAHGWTPPVGHPLLSSRAATAGEKKET